MTRRALIIANGLFSDERIKPLESPATDAVRLANLLQRDEIGGYNISLCIDESSSSVRLAIQDFCDGAERDDLNLILISGHGIKDRGSKLHFTTRDTSVDRLSATAVEARYLIERMDESSASQQILFLDTCFSGAFQRGVVSKAVADPISAEDFGNDDLTGKAVVTASSAVQLAGESPVNGIVQSVFSRHLIEGIETGRADQEGTGIITLGGLFNYIRAGVRRETHVQSPKPFYYGLDGSVVVALNPLGAVARLPPELQARLSHADKVVRGALVEDLVKMASNQEADGAIATRVLKILAEDDSLFVSNFAARGLERVAENGRRNSGELDKNDTISQSKDELDEFFSDENDELQRESLGKRKRRAKLYRISVSILGAVTVIFGIFVSTLAVMRAARVESRVESGSGQTTGAELGPPNAAAPRPALPAQAQRADFVNGQWHTVGVPCEHWVALSVGDEVLTVKRRDGSVVASYPVASQTAKTLIVNNNGMEEVYRPVGEKLELVVNGRSERFERCE
jgi:hypothetical protein